MIEVVAPRCIIDRSADRRQEVKVLTPRRAQKRRKQVTYVQNISD